MDIESILLANLGFVDPIGSNNKINFEIICSNLKLGIGVPWAGQVKAILEPRVLIRVCDATLLENFGFVDPIGSNN